MRLFAILAVLVTAAAVALPDVSANKPQSGGEGQACMAGKKCRGGLTCNTANVCVARTTVGTPSSSTPAGVTTKSKLGQACTLDSTCEPDVCGPAGVCAVRGKLGEACIRASCEVGLACTAGICGSELPRKLGEACTVSLADCEQGLSCTAGVCTTASGN